MEKLNPFQIQLEEAVRVMKEALGKQLETAQTAFDVSTITLKQMNDEHDRALKNVETTHEAYRAIKTVNSKSQKASLAGKNILNNAGVNVADSAAANAAIAKAAKSIEMASQSISQLSSDAAAILAKASSEDGSTDIEKTATDAAALSKEASTSAEKTTITALDATIAAAQSNTGAIQDILKSLSAELDALATSTSASLQNTQALLVQVDKAYTDNFQGEKKAEWQVSKTAADLNAAQVNYDNVKIKSTVADDKKK